jgi:transcriptional antiterminator RfaH
VSYWTVAQVEGQQERAAQHFLRLNGFESYCPRLRVMRRNHGRQIVSKPPLFPCYIFLEVVNGWWSARWCPHVVRLILNGMMPAVVPDCVIAEIQSREHNGLIELPKLPRFKPGDTVRIGRGAFQGRLALYADQPAPERVAILLQLLGAARRLELAADAVEAV